MLPALATGWVWGAPLILSCSGIPCVFHQRDDSHLNLWLFYSASGWKGSQPLSWCLVDKFDGVGLGVGGEGGGEMREGFGRAGQREGGAVLGSLWRWLEDWDGGSEAAWKNVLRRFHRGQNLESRNRQTL